MTINSLRYLEKGHFLKCVVIRDFLMMTLDIYPLRKLRIYNPVNTQLSGNCFGIDYGPSSFASILQKRKKERKQILYSHENGKPQNFLSHLEKEQ